MKILRIGDPHVKHTNVDECERLMHFIVDLALKEQPDRIEILGDLFHTHYLIRLEVLEFWNEWLDVLSEICEVFVLEGNHDQYGDADASYGTIRVFKNLSKLKMRQKKSLHIIDTARGDREGGIFGYMPHIHDEAKFLDLANNMANNGVKVLVCHQTFKEAKYENGMYAPDGFDSDKISPNIVQIISGHIHTEQEFGRVDYPGTPKWDTASDANKRKGVWIYIHDDATGKVLSKDFISTEGVCSPIERIEWREGTEEPVIKPGARVSIELIGSSDWVTKQKNKLKGKASISTTITDRKSVEKRQTGNSLEVFVDKFYEPSTGIDRQKLLGYMREMKVV